MTLPSNLQSFTFGGDFSWSLENVRQLVWKAEALVVISVFLPSSLQHLTFGHDFDHSLEGVSLPSSLLSLSFGCDFTMSLELQETGQTA